MMEMITRRTVLSALGTAVAGRSIGTTVTAQERTASEYVFSQGDQCVPVRPIRGDEPVEAFYDYRLPERHVSEENGASAGSTALYSSAGTTAVQRPRTSIAFLYQGPDRLSLVLVHGSLDAADGGAVSFDVSGLPADGEWAVKDDLYRNPETGDLASTNYDRWNVDGTDHRIDWTWGSGGTDGGAFAGLGDDFAVVVDPKFDEAATLYGDHYDGTVTDWTFVSGPLDDTDRHSLDMDEPVTVRTGSCEADSGTGTPTESTEQQETETKATDEATAETETELDDGGDEGDEETETKRDAEKAGGDEAADVEGDEAEDDEAEDDETEDEDEDSEAGEAAEEVNEDEEADDAESTDEGEHAICHKPPGNPENARTKRVGSESAVDAHLGHGDSRGACSDGE